MLSRFSPSLSSGGALFRSSRRLLNVHEYIAHQLINSEGVASPAGIPAKSPAEASEAAKKLGGHVAVKAQVLAGGRGLGVFSNGFKGGVQLVHSPEAAAETAGKMLGSKLVTKQTGAEGKPVDTVLISKIVQPDKQFYFGITMDRGFGGPVLIGSSEGGVDIEGVAEKTPEKIVKIPLHPDGRLEPAKFRDMAEKMGIPAKLVPQAVDVITRLYTLFEKYDATLVEINPLATVKGEDNIMCFDCKLNFDDNAAPRQKKIFALRDEAQEDPRDVAAAKWDLNYIGLEGEIACLVNGAGLAMATMDAINLSGGRPANFLDVGGSATKDQVCNAFRIITADPHVKAIFVNIFGGIMKCDIIAQGIIEASKDVGIKIPLVVRLKGTNSDIASKLIQKSNLPITYVEDFELASNKVVQLAREYSEKQANKK